MPTKTYNWSLIAADYGSSFMRNRIWTHALPQYPRVLKLPPLPLGIIGRGSDIDYVTDMKYWQAFHEAVSKRAHADLHFVDRHINMILVHGEEMNRWSQTSIFNADLSRASNVALWSLFREFIEHQSMMYLHGIVIVLLDFHRTLFIEGNLGKILRSRVSDKAYQSYYSVFTEPIHNSFAQDQEEDLLRIMTRSYHDPRWRRDVQTMTFDELRERYPAFTQALSRHSATYAWVYYVYSGPSYSEEQFLDFVRDYLVRGVNPSVYLGKLFKKRKVVRERKKRYLARLSPNSFERMILHLAGKIVWSKPRRKDLQSRTYYHVEKLSREIAKRFHLSLAQARSIPFDMLERALVHGDAVDIDRVNLVERLHVCFPNRNGKIVVLVGKDAQKFAAQISKSKIKDVRRKRSITGTTAFAGKARGIVRIVNKREDMQKMEYGNILVSVATTPAIVMAMKRAAAVVTEEGGLTCHASIVSRELEIPCVVGTKIATSVFRDGDRVEVDASRGIVTKIT